VVPRFSIITPVYNPPRDAFEACVGSVLDQSNGDWEWCLSNDASPDEWVSERLAELQLEDSRIRIVNRLANGGIVAASNDAISIAQGDFLVLLDNDDELHPDALRLVAETLDNEPNTDYLYSDEDKLTPDGTRFDAFAKPVWSPERLLAQNYTSHLSVLRRTLVDAVGRFRDGFDGSQDYDLVLRVVEKARHIAHVPHVLYHWRSLPTSTASSAAAKPYAFVAAMKAVNEHLTRCGTTAEVSEAGPSLARVRRVSSQHPLVSIVIATDWRSKRIFGVDTLLVTNVMASLSKITTYNNYEVVLVVPPGSDESLISKMVSLSEKPVKVVHGGPTVDIGQYLNAGLVTARSQHAVLLDQHCEFIDGDWLETLLGYTERTLVAAVAPILIDEYWSLLSAGLGFSPEPHDIGFGRNHSDLGPVGMLAIARECYGVSTRCALVDVAAVKSVGGFSPEFTTRLREFDLAAKLRSSGHHAITTPLVRVRVFDGDSEMDSERTELDLRWGHHYGKDPFTRVDTRVRTTHFVNVR
jgi:glycosyltransferase involved in cell wall biosynthesis